MASGLRRARSVLHLMEATTIAGGRVVCARGWAVQYHGFLSKKANAMAGAYGLRAQGGRTLSVLCIVEANAMAAGG